MPDRRCAACLAVMDKQSLVRFVVAGGAICVDPLASERGRGAYLCGRAACLDAALRRDAQVLRRALRATDGTVAAERARLRYAWQQATRAGRLTEENGRSRGQYAHEE